VKNDERKSLVKWIEISKDESLDKSNFNFFKKNSDMLFWSVISSRKDLTYEFIDHFQEDLVWIDICKNRHDLEFFKRYSNRIPWDSVILQEKKFLEDPDNIRFFADRIDFKNLSNSKYLTEELIEEFEDELYHKYLASNTHLSDKIRNKYKKKTTTI